MDSNTSSANKKFKLSNLQSWLLLSFISVFSVFLLSGCDQPQKEKKQEATDTPPPKPISDITREAWNHYHIHGVDIFSQPVECISTAKQTITQLIQDPDEALLDTARSYIKSCKETYRATTFFVAAESSAQKKLAELHQRINAPLEMPGFIDSVQGYPFSGIVNDASMPLTKNELLRQHGLTDPSDVSIGFAVLEFLLWGETIYNEQHEPRPIEAFNAATEWQPKDIELGLNELDINEHPNNRRRKYLELAMLILESDLNQLATTWNKNTLPPLNQSVAGPLKGKIKSQIAKAIGVLEIETMLPLFADSTATNESLSATSYSQWLGIVNHDDFKILLDEEAPLATKQKALLSIFDVKTEK